MQVNCWVYESYGSKPEMIWWLPMSCGYPKPSKSWMTILVLKPMIFGYIPPSLEAPMYSLAFFIILQETVLMELVHGTGTDIHVDVGCNKAPHYDPVPPQCTKIHLISSLENESIMFWLTILIQSWYPQNLQHKLVANLTMPGLGMRMALKATRKLPVPDHSRPRMTLSRASVFLPSTWQLDVSNSPTLQGPNSPVELQIASPIWLVGGAITILKNDGVRQWEGLSHIWWKIKHVWNHQPDDVRQCEAYCISLLGLIRGFIMTEVLPSFRVPEWLIDILPTKLVQIIPLGQSDKSCGFWQQQEHPKKVKTFFSAVDTS